MFSRLKSKNIIRICFLFLAAFFVGTGAAFLHDHFFPAAVPTSSEGNWGLSFQTDGDPPVGNATFDELKKFDAFYAQDTGEKVIYLTFDAGYENGNTPAILEALTKHQAPATFFVVGTLLESNPELIKQILAAGNTIGNHTWHHKDMSQISTMESFSEEIQTVEKLYRQITGQEISRFYRPPQGKYSEANLKMAQSLAITHSSGVSPMSTGIRITSHPTKRLLKNCLEGSIPVPSFYSTVRPLQTLKS